MLPDRVSNPGPLTYESSALLIALRGPASCDKSFSYLTVIEKMHICFNPIALRKAKTP